MKRKAELERIIKLHEQNLRLNAMRLSVSTHFSHQVIEKCKRELKEIKYGK